MVGSRSEQRENILDLLYSSGLMGKQNADRLELKGNLRITNKGFQFLLQDANSQAWLLLLQYVELSEKLGMNMADGMNITLIYL